MTGWRYGTSSGSFGLLDTLLVVLHEQHGVELLAGSMAVLASFIGKVLIQVVRVVCLRGHCLFGGESTRLEVDGD